MYAVVKPSSIKSILPTIGITLALTVLAIGAVILVNYTEEQIVDCLIPVAVDSLTPYLTEPVDLTTYFAEWLHVYALMTQVLVIATMLIYLARQWAIELIPALSRRAKKLLLIAAYAVGLALPALAIISVTGAGIYLSVIDNDYSGIIVFILPAVLAGAMLYALVKLTWRKSELLCEVSVATVTCISPIVVIAPALVILLGAAALMLALVLYFLPYLIIAALFSK